MDFDGFLEQAWSDHAEHPAAVAQRLQDPALPLPATEDQIVRLAHLAHHVWGEHLGQWAQGLQFQQRLAELPLYETRGASGSAVARYCASLQLAAGEHDGRAALAPSEGIRVSALAAASLCGRDALRAGELLKEALAQAEAAQLPDADPSQRTLAMVGNNLACALEDKPTLSAAERELMILAAQTGRRFWAMAGTWLEVAMAEYRLCMSWLKAGEPRQALHHARACLALMQANAAPPLEAFFAWQALGLAEHASGQSAGHVLALAAAQAIFAELDEAGRAECQGSLQALAALAA